MELFNPKSEIIAGNFTPTVAFATVGDSSIEYTSQLGTYLLTNGVVFINIVCSFTPTYTTASGELRLHGLPFAAATNTIIAPFVLSNVEFPANTYYAAVQILQNQTYGRVLSGGPNTSVAPWGVTQFPSGTARNILINGFYVKL